jgi:DNA ligase-1
LHAELARIQSLGGEGLMLREPGSHYEVSRSSTLLKVKTFHDAEARVVEHVPGRGRHKGRLGALRVMLADGTCFSVGSGLSDAQRECPPPVGATITFRYQELTNGGVPRFPTGQSQTKTFYDVDEAARHAAKVTAAKVKKGYAEVACV